ncbi:hypothetical protein C8J57DRAFT_1588395 [Mycena rebaudengoi]|nr:hypothetical protein C8J57DRAFT_1588395 [Mycena rebaudengoi]
MPLQAEWLFSDKAGEVLQSSLCDAEPAEESSVRLSRDSIFLRFITSNISRLSGRDFPAKIPRIIPRKNGLVETVIAAYNLHHALVIRPDDVWLAILVQFNFFVNANAELLRANFVAHEGKKELLIVAEGTRYNLDFGSMSRQMVDLIEKNLTDPTLREWVLPNFTTTTINDITVSAVVMMATMKAYFSYRFRGITCGIPRVTLEDLFKFRLRTRPKSVRDAYKPALALRSRSSAAAMAWTSCEVARIHQPQSARRPCAHPGHRLCASSLCHSVGAGFVVTSAGLEMGCPLSTSRWYRHLARVRAGPQSRGGVACGRAEGLAVHTVGGMGWVVGVTFISASRASKAVVADLILPKRAQASALSENGGRMGNGRRRRATGVVAGRERNALFVTLESAVNLAAIKLPDLGRDLRRKVKRSLEGERSDWVNILGRLEKLKEYGIETIAWYHLLHPVISRFVATFDEPESPENLDFWRKIAHHKGGSGVDVFSDKGAWIGSPLKTWAIASHGNTSPSR